MGHVATGTIICRAKNLVDTIFTNFIFAILSFRKIKIHAKNLLYGQSELVFLCHELQAGPDNNIIDWQHVHTVSASISKVKVVG